MHVRLLTILAVACSASTLLAQYDPPPGYYDSATSTDGPVLEGQLHNIIDNHVVRSYGDARDALQILDEDPADANRIILIYNGQSVNDDWDAGITWNREHQWPRSLGVDSSGPDNSDLFNLRPCNPSLNSSRGNQPYGIGGGYWDPDLSPGSINDRGDCSRAMFYMAVRYDGSDSNTVDLEVVNGFPGSNQMGDLNRMLEWHYTDPVDGVERRRNHLIYSSSNNPLFYQGNRNPFIDRPEFVWAIWGGSPNESTMYVGAQPDADGGSQLALDYRLIVGASTDLPPATLNKTGSTPTTYNVTFAGDIETPAAGNGQAFPVGTTSRTIDLMLEDTGDPGSFGGTITFDNTDLTSAGTGQGSDDQDDVISITATVLEPSEASFSNQANTDVLLVDFGQVSAGTGPQQQSVTVYNLESTPGFTASMDIDDVSGNGDVAVLIAELEPVADIPSGQGETFSVLIDTGAGLGSYQVSYDIEVSDENIPGASPGDQLVLNIVGEIVANKGGDIPTTSDWGVLCMALLILVVASTAFRRTATA
ncbi:MAG: endonuclease [Planctomycetota bacterium]|jgi:endonuclease I